VELDTTSRHAAAQAFRAWAEAHPRPDYPLFYILDGEALTPRRLAREVQDETRIGLDQVAAMQELAAEEGLSLTQVLERLPVRPAAFAS
jgi:hypothetical protein